MQKYVIQSGDTFDSLSAKLGIKDGGYLKTFHNLYCPEEDIMQEPIPGKGILIPEDPQFVSDKTSTKNIVSGSSSISEDDVMDPMNGYDDGSDAEEEQPSEDMDKEEQQKEDKKKQDEQNDSSEHDGKYFIVQKGMCQCNQGFKFPKFKVTSHKKHYWNDADGQADYLAVTEDDVQLDPPAQPFGQCKLKPTSGGYLPCAYAPAGKWQKTYKKVQIMGKSCLTELSELMCSTGGKITIFKHGQQSEAGKSHVANANSQEQQAYNPAVDFEEFKEDTLGTDQLYYS